MGGNLLKGKRILSIEYPTYLKNVCSILNDILIPLNMSINTIPHIKEKEDHGDIDIVIGYETAIDYVSIYEALNNKQNITNVTINSSNKSIHFLYNGVQVDLIFIQNKSVDYAVNYFSYNDLGNLLGIMCKRLGFKHGHLGLSFNLMYNTTVIEEYYLTNDFYSFLNILGLKIQTFKDGFDTYKEMFNYVLSSPYFNCSIYQYSNLNHVNRTRDRKRKTYNMFLDYMSSIPFKEPYKLIDTPYYYVYRSFPNIIETAQKALHEYVDSVHIRKALLGILRSEIYKLEGKELGEAMVILKNSDLYKLPFEHEEFNRLLKEYRNENH